jgi:hypothetical protein
MESPTRRGPGGGRPGPQSEHTWLACGEHGSRTCHRRVAHAATLAEAVATVAAAHVEHRFDLGDPRTAVAFARLTERLTTELRYIEAVAS